VGTRWNHWCQASMSIHSGGSHMKHDTIPAVAPTLLPDLLPAAPGDCLSSVTLAPRIAAAQPCKVSIRICSCSQQVLCCMQICRGCLHLLHEYAHTHDMYVCTNVSVYASHELQVCSFLTMHALTMHTRVKMIGSELPGVSPADFVSPVVHYAIICKQCRLDLFAVR